jgi:uncharacterized protein (TIGR03435 family)
MPRAIALASLLFSVSGALGQPTEPASQFEAVSIKPSKSGEGMGGIHPSRGGRLTAANVTLRDLIKWAYRVRDSQISGEPGWVNSERFDVAAKADGNPRFDFIQPALETMFQSVLADRFKLTLHRQTKDLPVYLLLVAKNGPKIHPVDEGNCPEVPAPENPCRFLRPAKFGQLTAEKAPMAVLASLLGAAFVGRGVVDKTDLKGSFSYTLDWTSYVQPPEPHPGAGPPPPNAIDPLSVEPAIAAALQEQLGLKLESGEAPLDILVIDHVERPSEN